MRRLYLKLQLWMAGYCTTHLRRKAYRFGPGGGWSYCPDCEQEAYDLWRHKLRLMREEYQELNAKR